LDQKTRRWNAVRHQLSLAEQIVYGGTHDRYGDVATSTPSPLTCQIHVADRHLSEVVSAALDHFDDLGQQQILSAVTLGGRVALRQRNDQRQTREGKR